jgi:hypothetical protein
MLTARAGTGLNDGTVPVQQRTVAQVRQWRGFIVPIWPYLRTSSWSILLRREQGA